MNAETDRETLQLYLDDESRRGAPLPSGFDGAAGGAPCGDLIRVSIEISNGSIARVSFDAEGCATARAAGAAVAELADGAALFDGGPRRAGRGRGNPRRGRAAGPPRGRARRRRAASRARRGCRIGTLARAGARGRRAGPGRAQRRSRLGGRRAARARARGGGGRGHPEAVGGPPHRCGAQLLLAGRGARRPLSCPSARHPAFHPRPRGRLPRSVSSAPSSTATAPAGPRTRA